MPKGSVRYQHTGNFHFVTFSCYKREPLFAASSGYGIFEEVLEKVRQRHGFVVAGYVVMPEHVHLLVSEPCNRQLSTILQMLKQQVSRKLKRPGDTRFWQRRSYDVNVWNHDKTSEKLKYMHRNPVRRCLVARPQDWRWSSFRHYLNGEDGTVEIESDWTAWKRENHEASTPPPFPTPGKGRAPKFVVT